MIKRERESILKIFDDAKWFEGKHIEDNSQSNLRSFVAQKQSISERLEKYFQVHYLSRDQVLRYDMNQKESDFSIQYVKWGRSFPR
jgi:hypothetical protein